MNEIIVNLHMHTEYSDGHASHAEIAAAAIRCGLDVVIVTDHNILVTGPERYYQEGKRRVLLLIGEEIHDQARQPQKNHLLVFGAGRELAMHAFQPQRLLDFVRQYNGLAFFAHPIDPEAPAVHQGDLSWVDWQVQGFTGIELWNGFSEFKARLKTIFHALYYALNPKRVACGPFPETLQKWDELLGNGKRIAAIGGSDAHALPFQLGPFHFTIFPYDFHFKAINTHLFIPNPLTGDEVEDRRQVLAALGRGRGFIGYDLPASTRGFRFTAQGKDGMAWMGDEISAQNGVTLQVRVPSNAECLLKKDGKIIKTWQNRETFVHITNESGVYRVEAYVHYLGKRRGWIFSNPIYVTN